MYTCIIYLIFNYVRLPYIIEIKHKYLLLKWEENKMTYSIKITDSDNNLIGTLPAATPDQVRKFLKKGLIVIDTQTGNHITEQDLNDLVGVSECVMEA